MGWGNGTLEASFEKGKNLDSHADQTDGNSGMEETNDLEITRTEGMRAHLQGVLKQKGQGLLRGREHSLLLSTRFNGRLEGGMTEVPDIPPPTPPQR